MSKLTKSDVNHVADLADFEFSEKEIKKLQKELSETLSFIKRLEEVDTQKVEPTSQVTDSQNVLREDVSRPSLSQNQALKNAPQSHNNFFKTKSIFS